jgi:hypothetical protein
MLFELGIPFEHDDLLPRSPGTKTPEFLALNPNSRVPVIEDDGFVLTESMGSISTSPKSTAARSILRIRATKRSPGSGASGKSTGWTARSRTT